MNLSPTYQEEIAQTPEGQVEECQHHWVVEAPSGPLSSGYCKNCGKIRQFANSVESFSWEDKTATGGGLETREIPVAARDDTY